MHSVTDIIEANKKPLSQQIHQLVAHTANAFMKGTSIFSLLKLKNVELKTHDELGLFAEKAAGIIRHLAAIGDWHDESMKDRALSAAKLVANIHQAIAEHNESEMLAAYNELSSFVSCLEA